MELQNIAKSSTKLFSLLLRIAALVSTLTAAIIMATSRETVSFFTITFEAKYSDVSAFKYFVAANILASLYSFGAVFVPQEGLLGKLLVALDAIFTLLLTSSLSAALAIGASPPSRQILAPSLALNESEVIGVLKSDGFSPNLSRHCLKVYGGRRVEESETDMDTNGVLWSLEKKKVCIHFAKKILARWKDENGRIYGLVAKKRFLGGCMQASICWKERS